MANALVSFIEEKTTTGIFWRKTFTDTSRQPLVLVMGYGGSLRIWPNSFVERLAQRYVVITYDNRGTGKSLIPDDTSEYSIENMAGDLNEVLKMAGLSKVHLLGYSMGSCIALRYTHDYADKVLSLFLMCGTAGGRLYGKPAPELSYALANPQGETLWDLYLATFRTMYSEAMMEKCMPTFKAIYENSKELPTQPPALLGHSFAFKGFDGSDYLKSITVPTTILAGADDRLMPRVNSENLAAGISGAKLVLLPGCEHGPHIEDEDAVVREIEALAT